MIIRLISAQLGLPGAWVELGNKKKKKKQANKVGMGLPGADGETSSSEQDSPFLAPGPRESFSMDWGQALQKG